MHDIKNSVVNINEKILWHLVDEIRIRGYNKEFGGHWTYNGYSKITYLLKRTIIFISHPHYINIYGSDSFDIVECRNKVSLIDRLLGKSKYCMKYKAILNINNNIKSRIDMISFINSDFNRQEKEINEYLSDIENKDEKHIEAKYCSVRLNQHCMDSEKYNIYSYEIMLNNRDQRYRELL